MPLLLVASLSSVVYQFADKPEEEKMVTINDAIPGQNNDLIREENARGWISLFDGKSKKGWHIYNNTSDYAPYINWSEVIGYSTIILIIGGLCIYTLRDKNNKVGKE